MAIEIKPDGTIRFVPVRKNLDTPAETRDESITSLVNLFRKQ